MFKRLSNVNSCVFFPLAVHPLVCYTESHCNELFLLSAGRSFSPGKREKAFLCHKAAPKITVKRRVWRAKRSPQKWLSSHWLSQHWAWVTSLCRVMLICLGMSLISLAWAQKCPNLSSILSCRTEPDTDEKDLKVSQPFRILLSSGKEAAAFP